jgi:hypothetical protein
MDSQGRGADGWFAWSTSTFTVLCALALICVLLTPGSAAWAGERGPVAMSGSPSAVVGSGLATPPEEAISSWTARDLAEAEPAGAEVDPRATFDVPGPDAWASAATGDFVPTDIDQPPLRAHGKVFFKIGENNFVCSGTVVNSRGRNIVMTAGHCVYNTEIDQYVDELVFIPAYDADALQPEPFGRWAATAVFTSRQYAEQGRLSHDIGAVVMADRIQDTVGSRRIAFDLDPARRQYTIYGYPAAPTPLYDGRKMIGCRSQVTSRDWSEGSPQPMAAEPCDMAGGSSGGGWITSSGFLNSLVSYGYCEPEASPAFCGTTYGPYFGDQVEAIYTFPAVGGSATPSVKIAQGPRGRVRGSRATFRFEGFGSTPVSFRCRLDRGPYTRCAGTTTFKRLRRGSHTVRVYSVDQTGRTSRGTVTRSFRATG